MLDRLRRSWTGLRQARGWAGIFFGPAELQAATVSPTGEPGAEPAASLPAEPAELPGRWQAAAQALRLQLDPQAYRIVTAIGAEDALCQVQQLPAANDAELRQMLDLQLDNLTPLPADEVVYGFETLGTADGQTRVLVVIAHKAAVNERVAALEAAGLPAEVVTVDAVAVFRGLVRRQALPADDRQSVLIVVTPTALHQIVYCRQMLVAVRSLTLPADGQVDAALVEELRRTDLCLASEAPAGTVTVLNLSAGTQTLADQVSVACGGERLPDKTAPPPARTLCPEGGAPGTLNLLPAEWRQRRQRARLRQNLIRGGIAAAALYVAVLAVWSVLLLWRRTQLNSVRAEIRALQPEYRQARDMHSEMTAMQRQLDTKYSGLEVLREVSLRLSDSLKLSAFIFRKDQKVTLRGQSQTAAAALEFVGQLEKCDLFSEVKTVTMSTPPGGGLTKFEVECRPRTAVAAAPSTGGRTWR